MKTKKKSRPHNLLMSKKGIIPIDKVLSRAKKRWPDNKKLREDLEFARRTEEAWKRIDKGEFKSVSADDFLKSLEDMKTGRIKRVV